MTDILFRSDDYIFSYRVAGVIVRADKILLQRSAGDHGFSIPGGHVTLGETNAQTLAREFKEEIGADVEVGDLCWVGEIFFRLEGRPWHQICLFYAVHLVEESQLPTGNFFLGQELMDGVKSDLEFHWVPVAQLESIPVYPRNVPSLMKRWDTGIQHFIADERGMNEA